MTFRSYLKLEGITFFLSKCGKKLIKDNLPRGVIAEAEELIPLLMLLAGGGSTIFSGSCIPIDAGEGKAYIA